MIEELYGPSLALHTDLYQLTMAAAAHRAGVHEREAVFQHFFRKAPFAGGFTVAAGLGTLLEFMRVFRFGADDIEYLATLQAPAGGPLFARDFLAWLGDFEFRCDVDAVPEGTVVFAQEPLLRVQGPIVACMLLETPLLNLLNFQTLIATKAARVALAARGDPVLEFGLRRAQGIDGGLLASRAAYVGGAAATSNVLAGKLFGIPVRGTHAHSWVMLYDDERTAFAEYARAMPGNCVFLVDTYDSLEGVRHAIEAGRELRKAGHELLGVRFDSGDLAWLSEQGRRMLDEAGFPGAIILASNDLDEHLIESLKAQGAKVASWGVGTRLVTGGDEAALAGVFKLGAVRTAAGWQRRLKLSEQTAKITTPGVLQVRRFLVDGQLAGDCIFDLSLGCASRTLVDVVDPTRRKTLPEGTPFEDLLVPVLRKGAPVAAAEPLDDSRARTLQQLARVPVAARRFVNPHAVPVGLEPSLHDERTRLILEARHAQQGREARP